MPDTGDQRPGGLMWLMWERAESVFLTLSSPPGFSLCFILECDELKRREHQTEHTEPSFSSDLWCLGCFEARGDKLLLSWRLYQRQNNNFIKTFNEALRSLRELIHNMNVTFSDFTLGRWLPVVFRESGSDSSGQRVTKREVLDLFCCVAGFMFSCSQIRNETKIITLILNSADGTHLLWLLRSLQPVGAAHESSLCWFLFFMFLDKWKENLIKSLSVSFFDSFWCKTASLSQFLLILTNVT